VAGDNVTRTDFPPDPDPNGFSSSRPSTPRLVEPYSLRMPKTGNLLLYVYEVQRGFEPGEGIKAFKVAEVGEVEVTDGPFQPQHLVEL
jgi:hypothetical protein